MRSRVNKESGTTLSRDFSSHGVLGMRLSRQVFRKGDVAVGADISAAVHVEKAHWSTLKHSRPKALLPFGVLV